MANVIHTSDLPADLVSQFENALDAHLKSAFEPGHLGALNLSQVFTTGRAILAITTKYISPIEPLLPAQYGTAIDLSLKALTAILNAVPVAS